MTESKKDSHSYLANVMETISWLFCTCVLFTCYNPVGELAKARGVEFSHIVHPEFLEPYVRAIPLIPEFVFVYIAVYPMPIFFLLSLTYVYGLDMGKIRRFFTVQMFLIVIAFIAFYAFPVHSDLLWNEETQTHDIGGDTWLHKFNFQFVHQGISHWVCFPSMHCAHSWGIALAFWFYKLPGASMMQLLAILTLASTIFTKPHHPPHLPAGVALAYLGQLLLNALEERRFLELKEGHSWTRFYMSLFLPAVFLALADYLHRISGWTTDVPAMFGFESLNKIGLYGF